jgi:hypothetical protein
MAVKTDSDHKEVDAELAVAVPRDAATWYAQRHLLLLNFCILSLVMFCRHPHKLSYHHN